MSKTVNQFAFPANFTSDNLKRLKELVRYGILYRRNSGATKSTTNADERLLDKLANIKRIKPTVTLDVNVSPDVVEEDK